VSPLRHSNKETLFLIDGSGFIFRAYHALPPLTRPDGMPVGAVLGFTNMLVKILTEMNAPYVAVIFDAGMKSAQTIRQTVAKPRKILFLNSLLFVRHAQLLECPWLKKKGLRLMIL